MRISLNTAAWTLSGWMKNQWIPAEIHPTTMMAVPAFGPVPATVPGAVQDDLRRAGIIKDWNIGTNCLDCEWVEHREWTYDCAFRLPPEMAGQTVVIRFDGLDYSGVVLFNGCRLGTFRGMHLRHEFDITAHCRLDGDNQLRVVFEQPPEVDGGIGYTSRKNELKSRFNYIWDWCPRLVNIGIWRDVTLESWDRARITDFYPRAVVDGEERRIDLALAADIDRAGAYTVRYTIQGEGIQVAGDAAFSLGKGDGQRLELTAAADGAALWWPGRGGPQPLYTVRAELIGDGVVIDSAEKRVGFRSLEFRQNTGSATSLPYTAVVNGKAVFLRGVNWVPLSPFYGTVRRGDYEKALGAFRDMGANILRVWGGAVLESADFYDLCDEYGLLVWQEFPQSSSMIDNTPCEDYAYLDDLFAVAEAYIRERRHHASQAVWCGGNELYWHDEQPVDCRSRNLNGLRERVAALDPGKYFLPASPSGNMSGFIEARVGEDYNHDVHGPWDYLGDPGHYHYCNVNDSLFTSETGCPGMARMESLRRYAGEEGKLWPPDERNPLYMQRGKDWIRLNAYTALCGEFEGEAGLADYIRLSRFIQAESLGYSAQAARRAWPRRSGILVWMGNEPYLNFANTSVLEFDTLPKPAYYRLQSAFAPVDAGARYEKLSWKTGETFRAEIVVTADDPGTRLLLDAVLYDMRGGRLAGSRFACVTAEAPVNAGTVEYPLSGAEGGVFMLRLRGTDEAGCVLTETDYLFTADATHPFGPIRHLPPAEVRAQKTPAGYRVSNASSVMAAGLFGFVRQGDEVVRLDNGWFHLLPGESLEVRPVSPLEGELVLEGINYRPGDSLL